MYNINNYKTGIVTLVFILSSLGWVPSLYAMSKTAEGLPGPGDLIRPFSVSVPNNPTDATYLEMAPGELFQPAELDVELLLIEVLNVYCASCQFMKPYMNELFNRIEADKEYKGRVKMLGIAAGNDIWDVTADESTYDFPIFPDDDYVFHKMAGQPPTPFLIFARPYNQGRLVVIDSHLGLLRDTDRLFDMVRRALEMNTAELNIKPFKGKGIDDFEQKAPAIPISNEELTDKIRKSLEIDGIGVQEIKTIKLAGWGEIYSGQSQKTKKKVFARVVARKIPCIDCHDVFYVYSFAEDGTFLHFLPIAISKYGNQPWDEDDVAKIQNRFSGKNMNADVIFNSSVDAVSSATISSELIYDSIGKTRQILESLKKNGFIP